MVSLLSCGELDGFFLLVVRAVFMSCCFGVLDCGVLDCDPVFLTAFPPTNFPWTAIRKGKLDNDYDDKIDI